MVLHKRALDSFVIPPLLHRVQQGWSSCRILLLPCHSYFNILDGYFQSKQKVKWVIFWWSFKKNLIFSLSPLHPHARVIWYQRVNGIICEDRLHWNDSENRLVRSSPPPPPPAPPPSPTWFKAQLCILQIKWQNYCRQSCEWALPGQPPFVDQVLHYHLI